GPCWGRAGDVNASRGRVPTRPKELPGAREAGGARHDRVSRLPLRARGARRPSCLLRNRGRAMTDTQPTQPEQRPPPGPAEAQWAAPESTSSELLGCGVSLVTVTVA